MSGLDLRAALFMILACLAGGWGRAYAGDAEPPEALRSRLRAHVVTHDDYVRSVFYTWTSPEQVAALRRDKTLLVATSKTGGGRPSPFIRMLTEMTAARRPGHEVATLLLQDPALARRRYAWTSPFATVLGLGERSYGNALIEVTLRPQALIARFDPQRPEPFEFMDMQGHRVPLQDVLAAPARIGAIYHVRTQGPSDFLPFREYILCSEAMVRSWSVATPEIDARLAAEAALLLELRPYLAALPPKESTASPVSAWTGVPAAAPLVEQWRAAQAFANRKYRPLPASVDQIRAALQRYQRSEPPLTYSSP